MEHSLKKMRAFLPAGFLHRIPCLFHVLTIHGMCPTNRRQWADFLVSLRAPLHRQYKTARTELAGICYWKQGRCRLRQRLRAVMLCLEVPIRDTQKSPKIVCGLRTHSVECSKLGKTRIIADAKTGCLEMPHFLIRISRCIPPEMERNDSPFNYLARQKFILTGSGAYV